MFFAMFFPIKREAQGNKEQRGVVRKKPVAKGKKERQKLRIEKKWETLVSIAITYPRSIGILVIQTLQKQREKGQGQQWKKDPKFFSKQIQKIRKSVNTVGQQKQD